MEELMLETNILVIFWSSELILWLYFGHNYSLGMSHRIEKF